MKNSKKMDENYLDLVRNDLYNIQNKYSSKTTHGTSKKNKKLDHKDLEAEKSQNEIKIAFKLKPKDKITIDKNLKINNKEKQVKFIGTIDKSSLREDSPVRQGVKKRVATPHKTNNNKHKKSPKALIDTNYTEVLSKEVYKAASPSINNSMLTITKDNDIVQDWFESKTWVDNKNKIFKSDKKGIKRRLSEAEIPEMVIKKKKDKLDKIWTQLIFNDSPVEKETRNILEIDQNETDTEEYLLKKKIKKKKDKLDKEWAKLVYNDSPVEKETESILAMGYKKTDIEEVAIKKKKPKKKKKSVEDEDLCGIEKNTDKNVKEKKNKVKEYSPKLIKGPELKVKKTKHKDKKSSCKNTEIEHKFVGFNNTNISENTVTYNSLKKIITPVNGDANNITSSDSENYKGTYFKQKKNKKILKKSVRNDHQYIAGDFIEEKIKVNDSNSFDTEYYKETYIRPNTAKELINKTDEQYILDDCDNKNINVEGMEFKKFSSLFVESFNEQYLGVTTLNIPREHLEIHANDLESNDSIEEGETSSKIYEEDKIEDYLKQKNKKVKILDVKIVSKGIIQEKAPCNNIKDTTIKETSMENLDLSQLINEFLETSPDITEPVPLETSISRISPDIVNLKNKNKLIVLKPGQKAYFYGLFTLEVLYGTVKILGAELCKESGPKKVYSPRGSSLLYVENKFHLETDKVVNLADLVTGDLLLEQKLNKKLDKSSTAFLCTELNEHHLDFVENHISQKIFPEIDDIGPRVDFDLQGTWNRVKTGQEWEEILIDVPEDVRMAICGGKGVGKSTFLRFAINSLLRRFPKIRVVDLDPGQSELIVPGCISVVTLDDEVLGPNYTHLCNGDRLILSHINIAYDIEKYQKSVKYLVEYTNSLDPLPMLINFHGYSQGIGLDLTLKTLDLIKPSLVIQINSKIASKNFKFDLTRENITKYITEDCSLNEYLPEKGKNKPNELEYKFVKLECMSDSNEAWSLEARQGREINILSYLGKMMTENIKDLTSTDINMYSISYSALSITNLEGKTVSPFTVNANLVALCSKLEENDSIFTSYGYGFVRGVEPTTETLIILTPETMDTLEKVSHLVLGSVNVPPSLIMSASSIKGQIPYVNVGDPIDFGQFTKRSYFSPKKLM